MRSAETATAKTAFRGAMQDLAGAMLVERRSPGSSGATRGSRPRRSHTTNNHAEGCPTAALLGEIGRCGAAVRDAYSEGAQSIVQEIAAQLPPGRSDANRIQTALGLFTILVASLQLARAVTDPELSDQVLATGIRNALRVLDDPK